MRYDAVIFDLYGTLIDIRTDERRASLWRRLAGYLRYQGLAAEAMPLREAFFAAVRASQRASAEPFPEVELVAVWAGLLRELGHASPEGAAVPSALLFRSLSVRRIGLFPDSLGCLAALRDHYALGLVSDAQRVFLAPEIAMLGLPPCFGATVVSSDFGYRKPDARLFAVALDRLGVPADRAVYVGDNQLRDVGGAHAAGMAAVLLRRPGAPIHDPSSHAPDATVASLGELLEWLGVAGV